MRIIGIVLVIVGALTLGMHSFNGRGHGDHGPAHAERKQRKEPIPPAVGGIAIVSGLLFLVTDARRN